MDRLANLLGAQALALTDLLLEADAREAVAEVGISASERAALITLYAHPGRPTAWLGGILQLTTSGITRLVDRLEKAGLVSRTPGTDARSRQLQLTVTGTGQAEKLLEARARAMGNLVASMTADDRRDLERVLSHLVCGLTDKRIPALRICRMCDRQACASAGAECPLQHTVRSLDD